MGGSRCAGLLLECRIGEKKRMIVGSFAAYPTV